MNRQSNLGLAILLGALCLTGMAVSASELIGAEVESEIVPSPVEYNILLPPGYASSSKPLPLVLNLHGGGGSREALTRQAPLLDELWEKGELPEMVIVTPSVTARGFYMDYKDGSEKWETFIVGPFLDHLRETYNVTKDPKETFITGISMGGMGSARMAFKYPEKFGAVAAMEPGIEPILKWEDMRTKHRFWRADGLFERTYGKPVDPEYWAANNPASIVATQAAKIRNSGLQIYLEAGDEDQFWLYEGTEFLHRTLWDNRVKHEYHLVRGADHVGASMKERTTEAYQFLARTLKPWSTDLPPRLRAFIEQLDRQKAALDEQDHYTVK